MRRRVIAGGLAVAAVVGVGYTTYAANADAPSYRTAVAVAGNVEQTLDLAGSVEPAGRADLAFATSGTVAAVRVEAGDSVKAGAVLGSVDDTGFRKTLQQARATLASARAQLESDENDQVEAVTTTTTTTTTTPTSPTTPAAKPITTSDPAVDQLAGLQKAVTDAQSTVSASLAAAADALAAQQAACAEDPAAQACADALVAVQGAQEQVSTDQDALQVALDDLTRALSEALESQQQPEQPQEPEVEQPQVQQPQVQQQTTTQATQPSGSVSVSAATLAKDQAAIDAARAEVITAEQALRTATVTAPFAGTVVAADVAVGDSVSSGTAVFTLVAPGTTTVRVDATSSQVQQLVVGQEAVATPVGSNTELAGTVTQISTIPDDAGTYPVTVTLAKKHLDVATGLTASVSVVVGSVDDALTVPASAVTDGSVLVVGEDGTASRTPVTTGVVGTTTVEVTDGIEAGDEVVLADLDRALPTTDESSSGGLPGGGSFGGPAVLTRRDG